jgi:hypothetical protein
VAPLWWGSQQAPYLLRWIAMWIKQLILYAFNICGSILLLFMLACIGLLLMMLAILQFR